jgi:hypothetical protein
MWSLIFIPHYIIHGDKATSARQSLRNGELREEGIDLHRKHGLRWYNSVQKRLAEQMSAPQYCHRPTGGNIRGCNITYLSPVFKKLFIYIHTYL